MNLKNSGSSMEWTNIFFRKRCLLAPRGMKLPLFLSVVAAASAVTVEDLAARLDKVEHLVTRLEAENRALRASQHALPDAQAPPAVPEAAADSILGPISSVNNNRQDAPGEGGHRQRSAGDSKADASRRLQSSSNKASITYDGTTIVLAGGDVEVRGALNVSGQLMAGGVAFAAWASSTVSVTDSSNTLKSDQFTTVSLNLGGAFDSSSGLFTAPVRGIYAITVQIQLGGSCTGGMAVMPFVNGVAYNGLGFIYFNNEAYLVRSFTSPTELQAGDTVGVYMSSGQCDVSGAPDLGRSGMSGMLIAAL